MVQKMNEREKVDKNIKHWVVSGKIEDNRSLKETKTRIIVELYNSIVQQALILEVWLISHRSKSSEIQFIND